jgi:hypothetical protein
LSIKDLSAGKDFAQEGIAAAHAPLQILGSPYEQIHGEGRRQGQTDAHGLVDHVARPHDHEQIDITVLVGSAVSVGAEQDNLLRPEAGCHLPCVAENNPHRDIRAKVQALWRTRRNGSVFR